MMRKFSEWLKPHTYKKADQVIGNSKRLADDFGALIHKKVLTIYNPIDFKQIQTACEEPITEELAEEAKAYQGRLFITVGRLTRQKDMQTLLTGFSLAKHHNEAKLWIVGVGGE